MSDDQDRVKAPQAMPRIPSGPWRRWDSTPVFVICLAQSPADGKWNVVYAPASGKGWELYVETLEEWESRVGKGGMAKYTPLATTAAAADRWRGDTDRRSMLSTISAAYDVPTHSDEAAVEKNAKAGQGLGQTLLNTLVNNSANLRGHVQMSVFVQAMCDGEVTSVAVAQANTPLPPPPGPQNRIPQ